MVFGRSYQLARIFGIRIGVGISWFLVLFLYIFWFTPYFHSVLGGSETTAWVVTVASVLSFFVSIILHELAHAFVARRNGLQVVGIELWMLGGITRTTGTVETPGPEFRVAAAGPLATLLVIVVSLGIGAAITSAHDFVSVSVGNGTHASPALVWLTWLATLNTIVLAVNLLPAFPLGGGQIAPPIMWGPTRDRTGATQIPGRRGQVPAILVAAGGAVLLLRHDSI